MENGLLSLSLAHPPILCGFVYRLKKNLKNDRGRDCNLLPCRNASESPSGQ